MLRPISKDGHPHLCQLSSCAPRCVIQAPSRSVSCPIARTQVLAADSGGAEEIRTPDPLHAKQMLSQLSYGPRYAAGDFRPPGRPIVLVGHGGLEPPTSVLSGPRSNQLS